MNLLRFPRLWLMAGSLLLFSNFVQAQNAANPREIALRFLQENPSQFGLTKADVSDLRVTDEYFSKNNGITHVWVQQQHLGIPVFNGLFGLHVKPDGNVLTLGHRFVPGLAAKMNSTIPSLSAARAVEMAFVHLGFSDVPTPSLRQKINDRNFIFEGGSVSKRDIAVSACFEKMENGSARLAWLLVVEPVGSADVWSMRVDAQTGLVLGKNNRTVYCQAASVEALHDDCPIHSESSTTKNEQPPTSNEQPTTNNEQPATSTAAESYNVFALPVESPAHGTRQIVTSPADPEASPYGWLDTNAIVGPEFTYTRGNNVFAYDDRDNNNLPPQGTPFPNAGASLNFDFPYDPDGEPLDNLNASITNLFYVNNMMHDITYRYGFDEQAGNFQQNNYGNGGSGNDPVQANAIDGFGLSSPTLNNASFSTDPDGFDARMSMFVWSKSGGQLVQVNAPGPVEGVYSVSLAFESPNPFGADITNVPITGDGVVVNDGTAFPNMGCEQTQQDLTGKIALVDRGNCDYSLKAYYAQEAGAIGCIICNSFEAISNLGAGDFADEVNIPVVMLKKSDCEKLRPYAENGLNISLVRPPTPPGPNFLDGSFDNGIIAHEYAHGISNRLTGGPNNTDCLDNREQMGEGWSDFFALVTTVKPGDTDDKARGVATYVLRQPNDGVGARRFPYTPDMNINPLTYGSVAETAGQSQVHARGEVWTAACWDLYWAMVEKYGFDADLTNTNSGNGRAIQLVMDGMKLQPCSPGFIEGRDAILAADVANYGGADTCLISSVFARRGLGFYANQGSSFNAADGVENFDPIPACVKELKIKKETTTPLIEPGEVAEFKITVTNHKDEAAPNVVITDEVPAGLTFISASNGGVFSNGYVVWNLGEVSSGKVTTLTYTAKSADFVGSLRYFQDVMDDNTNWKTENANMQPHLFVLQDTMVKTGTAAWQAVTQPTGTKFYLSYKLSVPITGAQPVLRFWHRYATEGGYDAGMLEIQKTGEQGWNQIPVEKIFRNPYPLGVDYLTFSYPGLKGFSGNSGGWVQSYFDLSDYAGQEVTMRFRFGSNNDGFFPGPSGTWFVDEVEIMDLYNFDGEACLTSGSEQICIKAPGRGVVVQPGIVSTNESATQQLDIRIQPNPASDLLHITLGQSLDGLVQVQLVGTDGRVVLNRQFDNISEGQILTLDVQQVPAGVYFLRLENAAGNNAKKVVIR